MEKIRERFGFTRWMVVGGSWGATLALAYAQAHPERVSGLVLRATFLGTTEELDDVFLRALPRFYPGLYEDFLNFLPEDERASPLAAYYRRILSPMQPCMHRPRAPGTTPNARCRSIRRSRRGSTRPTRRAPCPRRRSWKRTTSPMIASCARIS